MTPRETSTLQNGLTDSDFAGKPVIAIVNTWSDMNTCHGYLRDVAQVVKRAVWETALLQPAVPWRPRNYCAATRLMERCCSAGATRPRRH